MLQKCQHCTPAKPLFCSVVESGGAFFWMGKRAVLHETEPILVRNWSASRKAVETFLFLSFVVIRLPSYSWKTNRHLTLDRYGTCSDALRCCYFPKAYWGLCSLDEGWGGKAEGCSDVSPVWFSPCKEDFISQQLWFKDSFENEKPCVWVPTSRKNVK